MTGQPAYTDADVEVAARAISGGRPDDVPARWALCDAQNALDAVAPAIAARAKREALREYARDLEANNSAEGWAWDDFVFDAREYAETYLPDAIEAP